jgi:hypothetical protein
MSKFARDFWIRIGLPLLAIAAIGYWLAQKLTAINGLQTFKVLNIVGLSFDAAGILFLSHFVLRNPRLLKFALGPVAEYTSAFFYAIPVGVMVSVHLGPDGPSHELVKNIIYSAPVMFVMLASIFFFGRFVLSGDDLLIKDSEDRVNYLGAFFLVAGVVTQIVAAVQDLYS